MSNEKVPEKESFYFGLYTCANCLSDAYGKGRKSFVLRRPLLEGLKEDSPVIIPAGRQSFHKQCLEELKEEIR